MIFAGDPASAARRLAAWYEAHGRHHLPWRLTRDPYAIWISEVMLQQTQVATVLARYYHPFLARFPDLSTLAAAEEHEVMKAWQGLGYYSRARNLHRAARLAAPAMPPDVETLHALPGIGRNTAHAIASFAYGHAVPVMEANVKRVLHRLLAAETLSVDMLWQAAAELLGDADPFVHNQAMMDVGSQVCTPRRPRCDACPLDELCLGKTGPERFPAKKTKAALPVRHRRFLIPRLPDGRLHLGPRLTRLLGSLYTFPEFDTSEELTLGGDTIPVAGCRSIGRITRTYTHFRLEAEILLLELPHSNLWFYDREHIETLPLSGLEKQILSLLDQSGQLLAI